MFITGFMKVKTHLQFMKIKNKSKGKENEAVKTFD